MKRYDAYAVEDGHHSSYVEHDETKDGDWCRWEDVKELIEELEIAKGCLDIERQKKQQLQKEIGYAVEP